MTRAPWLTPLDAAAARGDTACATLLLDAGAPPTGSSIVAAIAADAAKILALFHARSARFDQPLGSDGTLGANPGHSRRLACHSGLDYALATDAATCVALLERIGAPKAPAARCANGHYSPLLTVPVFVGFGGRFDEGLFDDVTGYCCERCGTFREVAGGESVCHGGWSLVANA